MGLVGHMCGSLKKISDFPSFSFSFWVKFQKTLLRFGLITVRFKIF